MISRSSFLAFLASIVLAACGGSADPPPPDEPGGPGPVPPTITQQPQSLTVAAGQPASFSVAASGTEPLSYQWQRNGVAISGATATTYALPATVPNDSGATFRAMVSNVAGSATSDTATLTVTVAAPVLTIAPQPTNVAVVAGASAAFTVGGTCSSGTLTIQWQRSAGNGFADIAGATSPTYAFTTALGDNGAQFRAALSCSGQAATTSNVATLTVTVPAGITLSVLPVNGLRPQAPWSQAVAVDALADGSFAFIGVDRLWRLAADRLSITPIAGGDASGAVDGAAALARFSGPRGLTHDVAGVVWVADTLNHLIRRIAADGTVSTIAGAAGVSGSTDGAAGVARFDRPWGIVLGPDGDLYVADSQNARIRRVTTAGVVSTYAGSSAGYLDGAPLSAQFQRPTALAVGSNGDLYVADDNRVRRIVRNGNVAGPVETLAGTGSNLITAPDGIGTAAGLPDPSGMFVRGNTLSLVDGAGLVRNIDLSTRAVTTFAGTRSLALEFIADGPPGVGRLLATGGLAPAASGGMVAVAGATIRSIDFAGNVITTATPFLSAPNETGVLAQLPLVPGRVTVDAQARVVVHQSGMVRRIDTAGNVALVAGLIGGSNAAAGNPPVDGAGSVAKFDSISALAGGAADVTYVTDSSSVRRIASDGTVTTVAGATVVPGAVNAQGAAARFGPLAGIAVGAGGDVFVADGANNAIRRVDAAGNTTTYAGVFGQEGAVDGAIAQARLRLPLWLAFTPDGTLWFSDGFAGLQGLRRIAPDGSTVATATGVTPGVEALAADPSGILYYMVNPTSTTPGGLYTYDPATSTSLLVMPAPINGQLVLGSVNPQLPPIQSIALLASRRILLSPASTATDRRLLVVTLP